MSCIGFRDVHASASVRLYGTHSQAVRLRIHGVRGLTKSRRGETLVSRTTHLHRVRKGMKWWSRISRSRIRCEYSKAISQALLDQLQLLSGLLS